MNKNGVVLITGIVFSFIVINVVLHIWISNISSEVNSFIDEECKYESVEKYSADKGFDKYYISLSQLVVNPQKYNNKNVVVTGYFKWDDEGALYLTEYSCKNNITKDAVMLYLESDGLPKERINHHTEKDIFIVIAEGTFNAVDGGIQNNYSGSLNDITRFEHFGLKDNSGGVYSE